MPNINLCPTQTECLLMFAQVTRTYCNDAMRCDSVSITSTWVFFCFVVQYNTKDEYVERGRIIIMQCVLYMSRGTIWDDVNSRQTLLMTLNLNTFLHIGAHSHSLWISMQCQCCIVCTPFRRVCVYALECDFINWINGKQQRVRIAWNQAADRQVWKSVVAEREGVFIACAQTNRMENLPKK